MEDRIDNKPILAIEENKDGSLSIGGGDYKIDKNGMLAYPAGKGMPHVRLSDLFVHRKSIQFLMDSLFVISISEDDYYEEDDDTEDNVDSEKEIVAVTIAIGYLGPNHEWPLDIDRVKYYQLAENCAHYYQKEHADDDNSDYLSVDCANSFINAHITSVYFDEALDKGIDFIDEVLQPINEIEKLIAQKIKSDDKQASNPEP